MPDNNKRKLYEWLDPFKNRKELKDTLRRLEAARKPRDIAYNVVANLQGAGKVNSITALNPDFIQALVSLAQNFDNGENDVAAVSYHIRKMMRDLEWHRKEREQEEESSQDILYQYIIVIKKVREEQKELIENYLDRHNIDFYMAELSDFDGNANSDETLFQIEGSAGELYDVLNLIESAFGKDAFDDISLTSVQGKTGKDALTMSQTINLLKNEL